MQEVESLHVSKPPPDTRVQALLMQSRWPHSLSLVHSLDALPCTTWQLLSTQARWVPAGGQLSGVRVQPLSPSPFTSVQVLFWQMVCLLSGTQDVEALQVSLPPPETRVQALLMQSRWPHSLSFVQSFGSLPFTTWQLLSTQARWVPAGGQLSGVRVQPLSPSPFTSVQVLFWQMVCLLSGTQDVEALQVSLPPPETRD